MVLPPSGRRLYTRGPIMLGEPLGGSDAPQPMAARGSSGRLSRTRSGPWESWHSSQNRYRHRAYLAGAPVLHSARLRSQRRCRARNLVGHETSAVSTSSTSSRAARFARRRRPGCGRSLRSRPRRPPRTLMRAPRGRGDGPCSPFSTGCSCRYAASPDSSAGDRLSTRSLRSGSGLRPLTVAADSADGLGRSGCPDPASREASSCR